MHRWVLVRLLLGQFVFWQWYNTSGLYSIQVINAWMVIFNASNKWMQTRLGEVYCRPCLMHCCIIVSCRVQSWLLACFVTSNHMTMKWERSGDEIKLANDWTVVIFIQTNTWQSHVFKFTMVFSLNITGSTSLDLVALKQRATFHLL